MEHKKLKNEELGLYHQRTDEKLEEGDGSQEVESDRTQFVQTEWNKIKNAIVEAVKETIWEKTQKRNEEWFDEEYKKAIQEKNNMRKIMLQRMTSSSK